MQPGKMSKMTRSYKELAKLADNFVVGHKTGSFPEPPEPKPEPEPADPSYRAERLAKNRENLLGVVYGLRRVVYLDSYVGDTQSYYRCWLLCSCGDLHAEALHEAATTQSCKACKPSLDLSKARVASSRKIAKRAARALLKAIGDAELALTSASHLAAQGQVKGPAPEVADMAKACRVLIKELKELTDGLGLVEIIKPKLKVVMPKRKVVI